MAVFHPLGALCWERTCMIFRLEFCVARGPKKPLHLGWTLFYVIELVFPPVFGAGVVHERERFPVEGFMKHFELSLRH